MAQKMGLSTLAAFIRATVAECVKRYHASK